MSSDSGEPSTGTVDDSREDFAQRPELIDQRRLKVEGKLKLGNYRHKMFPVVADSCSAISGNMLTSEDVGTKVNTRHAGIGSGLNGRPVLSGEQNSATNPIRHELLTDLGGLAAGGDALGAVQEVSDALGQGVLRADDLDGALERGNVILLDIHRSREYTNKFVPVNSPVCVIGHKSACIVLPMQQTPKKKPKVTGRTDNIRRQAKPGPDGQTLGQRLLIAMAYETGRRGTEYTAKELENDVNRLAGIDNFLSQQNLSAIKTGKVTRSSFVPLIARACHVDPTWLALGTGSMLTSQAD